MSKRKANAVARDLRTPKYRMRVEKPKKGKGSYVRFKKKDVEKVTKLGDLFFLAADLLFGTKMI